MRIAPVSGDLLVKLALFAGLGLGAWMLLQRAKAALPSWPSPPDWSTVGNWVNPASDQNLAYQGANRVVSAAVGYEETFGGWLYDVTHADPMAGPDLSYDDNWLTGGKWNNPSAYTAGDAPNPYNSYEGAAFGVYPRP